MTTISRATSARAGALALAGLALLAGSVLGPSAARAQFTLGEQRSGTASGTFLKIGLGARATGLGESFVAVANDPTAIYWNPAGLASLQRQEAALSHIEWPADIRYSHLAWVMPVRRLGGSVGFQLGMLSTELEETTELQPFGTGRTFVYSDVIAGVAYARRWTDKLLVGVGVKYVRENLGKDVGNPTTSSALFDIGSIYYLGLGSVRVATSLSNFSPELKPGGSYLSIGADGIQGTSDDEVRSYDGFDAPTIFRYGIAFEPIENASQRLTLAVEANQPADNAQAVKAGLEWMWLGRLALRTGYNFNADALKFSAGAGINAEVGGMRGTLDYAYTNGGFLGAINRVTLGIRF